MNTTRHCPKCNYTADAEFSECPRCGVIVSKFLRAQQERAQSDSDNASGEKAAMERLAGANTLMIRQKKEWGEILSGFETRNKYEVLDSMNTPLFEAEEHGGSLAAIIGRLALKALRPFTMHLFSIDGLGVYELRRPFRFYFHEVRINSATGAPLGKVKRQFSILRRLYSVLDRNGDEIFQLFGPLLHPWTFQIKKGEQELGKITKKWSGLFKEAVTDADNFGIVFPSGIELSQKAILLGAVFLIDFVHFEDQGK